MTFKWRDNLETGNNTIDSQHKALINAGNELLAACSEGKGREKISSTGKFLLDYTNKHFGDEEKIQKLSQYPDYEKHKKYHDYFVLEVGNPVSELELKGPSVVIVGKINNLISGWLFDHISREDVKVAAHVRTKQD